MESCLVFQHAYGINAKEGLLSQRRVVIGGDLNRAAFGLSNKCNTAAPHAADLGHVSGRGQFGVDLVDEPVDPPDRVLDLDDLASLNCLGVVRVQRNLKNGLVDLKDNWIREDRDPLGLLAIRSGNGRLGPETQRIATGR